MNPFNSCTLSTCVALLFSFVVNTPMHAEIIKRFSKHSTILPDGTYSWAQPPSANYGYDGRCGETAIANIISMTSHSVSPAQISKSIYDPTPGTHPWTLTHFLNNNAPGFWKIGYSSRTKSLNHLRYGLEHGSFKAKNKKSPVAILIQTNLITLHWVTVVDILDDDSVVINQDGRQERWTIDELNQMWGFANNISSLAARTLLANTCCSPYTMVYQSR